MSVHTIRERPELLAALRKAASGSSAEFAKHGDTLERYGDRLFDEFPDFQFHLVEGDRVVAGGRCLPLRWDGTLDDLPQGIDGVFERALGEPGDDVLCAVGIMVPPALRGRRHSGRALEAMIALARSHGFDALIAPVKPAAKDRYPLTPIERYAEWRREDGLPFDPWMRTHARLGGEILKPERRSVRVTGTVAEWEEWVGMPLPESGEYVIPEGLAPLEIDREQDAGRYFEPNVWMRHTAGA